MIALESIKKSILNPPTNWIGDPCLPREYSWTGVTCSEGGKIRIISLLVCLKMLRLYFLCILPCLGKIEMLSALNNRNLSSMGLSGTLSPSIGNLTALTNMWVSKMNASLLGIF